MEPTTSNNSIKAIKQVRKLFNELKNKYNKEEIKKTREELNKKEVVYNFFKEKEQESRLKDKEKEVLKTIIRYFKNFKKNYKS